MKRGKVLVEQVTKDGMTVDGYDESLSPTEIFERIRKYFPNIEKSNQDARILLGEYEGKKFAIRCKNVTYLGNPHPHFKKRIQISGDLFGFYKLAKSLDAMPLLFGIYSFGDNLIFVNFKIDTYIEKKAHNSSAHIYVSDLAAATEEGFFQKTDFFGNTVIAIRPDVIQVFLDEILGDAAGKEISPAYGDVSDMNFLVSDGIRGEMQAIEVADGKEKSTVDRLFAYSKKFKEDIAPKIKTFFDEEEKEWQGIQCYKKMIGDNYKNKYQPEWVGFFLEYEFEKYLEDNHLTALISFAQDKREGGIDLDLYFPTVESYGDLKAHSEDSRGIQGNDWDTIFGIINGTDEKNHIYYIVCEHSTEKDSIHDYEVTKYWNTVQGKDNLMSYSKRMKNSVRLKRVYILDINYANRKHLTMFKQGINSNGKPRAPKIMIEQDNLKYFIVEQIDL